MARHPKKYGNIDFDPVVFDDLIHDSLRFSDVRPTSIKRFIVVEKWLYRLGNSRNPDQSETVITLKGQSADMSAVYIKFISDTSKPIPPLFNDKNKILYMCMRNEQMEAVLRTLSLLPSRALVVVYYEYDTGHRWAELYHDWIP